MVTAERSREILRNVKTVIVDEVHALIRDKRGSHLSLTLARLDHIANERPARVGLSATVKPIEYAARFLVGADHVGTDGNPDCVIVELRPPARPRAVASRSRRRSCRRSPPASSGPTSTTGSRS